ncbi:MAG TPA: hypothetical protein VF145_10445, partial [Chitinophagaceae bacterium]
NSKPKPAATATTATGTTVTTTTQKIVTPPGMNPPHGEPGHRCDIEVGKPLNSAPKPAGNNTPEVQPAQPAKADSSGN